MSDDETLRPPPPDRHTTLKLARIELLADAERCRGLMSRDAWEERADALEVGRLCGPREIEAVGALIFGKRRGFRGPR